MYSNRLLEESEAQLFARIQSGSEEAYHAIFDRYWEQLFVVASRLLQAEDQAKDLIQDVFLSLWERRAELTNPNLGAYLMQAVKFQAFRALRDGKLTVSHEAFLAELPAPETATELSPDEVRALLEEHLVGLPPRSREVFLLSRVKQWSNRQIAEELGISQRTVETHISNALKHLRRHALGAILAVLLGLP